MSTKSKGKKGKNPYSGWGKAELTKGMTKGKGAANPDSPMHIQDAIEKVDQWPPQQIRLPRLLLTASDSATISTGVGGVAGGTRGSSLRSHADWSPEAARQILASVHRKYAGGGPSEAFGGPSVDDELAKINNLIANDPLLSGNASPTGGEGGKAPPSKPSVETRITADGLFRTTGGGRGVETRTTADGAAGFEQNSSSLRIEEGGSVAASVDLSRRSSRASAAGGERGSLDGEVTAVHDVRGGSRRSSRKSSFVGSDASSLPTKLLCADPAASGSGVETNDALDKMITKSTPANRVARPASRNRTGSLVSTPPVAPGAKRLSQGSPRHGSGKGKIGPNSSKGGSPKNSPKGGSPKNSKGSSGDGGAAGTKGGARGPSPPGSNSKGGEKAGRAGPTTKGKGGKAAAHDPLSDSLQSFMSKGSGIAEAPPSDLASQLAGMEKAVNRIV